MSELKFTLVITGDDAPCFEVDLGHQSVRALAEIASDEIAQVEYLSLLAEHPAASVRSAVAGRDYLSDAAVARLILDRDPDVRRALVQSAAFQRIADTQTVLTMIKADVDLATSLAYRFDDLMEADPAVIGRALATHGDPAVRTELARSGNAPRALNRVLAQDRDADVAAAGREALEQ